MSIPPHLQALLVTWNATLNAAKIENDEAVRMAATLLGFVIINATAEPETAGPATEDLAHQLLDETVDDIHDFITENYASIINNKRRPQ